MDDIDLPERSGIYLFILPNWRSLYVGRTNNLKRRYYEHVLVGSHKEEIKNYLEKFNSIEFLILEFTDGYSIKDQSIVEEYWINYYRKKNLKLLNITNPTKEPHLYEYVSVIQTDVHGNFIKKHDSISSAANEIKGSTSGITSVARGKQTSYKNSIWFYEEDYYKENIEERVTSRYKKVNAREANRVKAVKLLDRAYCSKAIKQFDLEGNFIRNWPNAKEVERQLKISRTAVCNCLNNRSSTAGGFVWKYQEFFNLKNKDSKGQL